MNVVIIGESFGFPFGSAAANYVRLMACGLVKATAKVTVIPLNYSEMPSMVVNLEPRGVYEGVSWIYTAGTTRQPTSLASRIIIRLWSVLMSVFTLLRFKYNYKLDLVIYFGRNPYLFNLYRILTKLIKVILVVHFVEWPPVLPDNKIKKKRALRYTEDSLKNADAVIVISGFLEKRAHEAGFSGNRAQLCHRMPLLLDRKELADYVEPAKMKNPYFLFCADLNAYIDDAIYIIKALSILSMPEYDLILVGRTSTLNKEKIMNTASSAGLEGNVTVLSDYISHDLLKSFYKGATALLAPLHDDERSLARFPSKIADYLLSGRPLVSNAIGEMSVYFKNGRDAFLCQSDDIADFADTLREAVTSPKRNTISENGFHLALKEFDYLDQTEKLYHFLEYVIASK